MTRLHMRLVAATAAVVVVCGLMVLAPARATLVPSGFRAVSFSAVGTRYWWLTGTIPCRFRHRCLALLRTPDGGSSFARVHLPTLVDVDANQFATAQFADPRDGYLAANRLWVTHDGGRHWRVLRLGGDVQSVATGGGFVYATVGTDFTRSFLMRSPVGHDDWTVLAEAPNGFEGVTVEHGIVLLDKAVTLGGEQQILISRDQGADFTASQPLLETSCDPDEATASVVWMLCRGGMMDGLFRSTDGGLTFAPPAGPTAGSENTSGLWPGSAGIAAASATTAVAGGQELMRTTDAGRIFKRVPLPIADSGWDVAFLNSHDGLALGRFGESAYPIGRLYYTTDAGASYRLVPLRSR